MRLFIFDGGRVNLPDMSHLTPGRNVGKPVTIPLLTSLIVHPQGLVLFDTGVDPNLLKDPFLEARPEQRIDRQMKQLGYETQDVKYVVMSHLHLDHMGCMHLFPEAKFIVRKAELRAAWWPDAYDHGYDFDSLMRSRELKYLQLGENEALDIFRDGSLVCFDTRGHTEGHQSLAVTLPVFGRLVLAGDAVQAAENLTDTIPPGMCWNNQLAVQAIERLQHLQDQGSLIVLGHDLPLLETLEIAPGYYQ